jgi:integrase
MNRVWNPALKRAGVRSRTPYQTRHTFATLALSAGEAIGWVSRQMGHSYTKMIIEHYYRFIPNLTRQDGSAFDKAAAQFGHRLPQEPMPQPFSVTGCPRSPMPQST